MPLELTFRTDDLARHDTLTIPDYHAGAVVVGRKKACDIFLPVPSLSGRHLSFTRRDAAWWVEDLGSTNGTFANGERLEPGTPVAVEAGMSLMTTGVQIVVRLPRDASEHSFTIETSGSMSKAMIKALLEQQQQDADPYFDLIAPGERARISLGMSFNGKRIGRHPDADVRTTLEAAPEWMFQVFEDEHGRVLLTPADGASITIAGQALGARHVLRHEDSLELGALTCRFFDPLEGDIPAFEEEERGDEPAPPSEAPDDSPIVSEPIALSTAPRDTPAPAVLPEPLAPAPTAPEREPALPTRTEGAKLGARELVVLAFALACVVAALGIAYVFLL